MSTVLLTLVVVGGSIGAAAAIALSGGPQPATHHRGSHRARRARTSRTEVDGIEVVRPRPSVFVQTRALLVLTVIVGVLGLAVAFGLGAAAAFVSRTLESAVS